MANGKERKDGRGANEEEWRSGKETGEQKRLELF